ncbi:MAG: YaaR family protein [Spirochaetales bacterium]|nr:YaaR family protein [Spirochaetales bacterium]
MEKIDLFGNRFILKPSIGSEGSRKKNAVEKNKFARMMDGVSDKKDMAEEESSRGNHQSIEEMLEEIEKAGECLKNSPTLDTVKAYKQVISDFLKDVSGKMMQVEEKVSGFGIRKRKRFTMITIVDKKLEELTLGVLTQQLSQLKILEKVDEINGMVVDLTR